MSITAKVPFEIAEVPTTPARTLTDLWLKRIVLDMPSTVHGIAQITAHPFDSTTAEVGADEVEHVFIKDLPLAIQEVPEAAVAYAAIVAAFSPLRDWQAAQDAPAPEPEPELVAPEPELVA